MRQEAATTTAFAILLALAGSACAPARPSLVSSVPRDAEIVELDEPRLDAFFRDLATYVWHHGDRETFERAACLSEVLLGATSVTVPDEDACGRALVACFADPPYRTWVYSCEVPVVWGAGLGARELQETVGRRFACVEESVCVAWPILAAELHCGLARDWDALAVCSRAYPTRACECPWPIDINV